MKRLIFFTSGLCLSLLGISQNDTMPDYKNEIRMGLLQLFDGGLALNYERKISDQTAIMIGGKFYSNNKASSDVLSYMVEAQYRYYLIKMKGKSESWNELNSVYVCPSLSISHWDITNKNSYSLVTDNDKINNFSVMFLIGIKFNVFERIVLDVNFGGGPKYSFINDQAPSNTYNSNMFSTGYSGVLPDANFTFGFTF